MKKKLALILAATMTVSLLASCGSSGSHLWKRFPVCGLRRLRLRLSRPL